MHFNSLCIDFAFLRNISFWNILYTLHLWYIKLMPRQTVIDYKKLRRTNSETARMAVLEYLSATRGNISKTARAFGIQRVTVYDILKKKAEGDLKDRSKTPKRVGKR